jgi:hypothetical protein
MWPCAGRKSNWFSAVCCNDSTYGHGDKIIILDLAGKQHKEFSNLSRCVQERVQLSNLVTKMLVVFVKSGKTSDCKVHHDQLPKMTYLRICMHLHLDTLSGFKPSHQTIFQQKAPGRDELKKISSFTYLVEAVTP